MFCVNTILQHYYIDHGKNAILTHDYYMDTNINVNVNVTIINVGISEHSINFDDLPILCSH